MSIFEFELVYCVDYLKYPQENHFSVLPIDAETDTLDHLDRCSKVMGPRLGKKEEYIRRRKLRDLLTGFNNKVHGTITVTFLM